MKNIIRTPETHPLTWRLRDDKQPVWLDEYRSKNGYEGARKALTGLSPDEIVNQVKDAGLKGRGGAGFSTGLKWSLMPKDESMNIRYLLCNADEMEPGTYKDRLLMEQLPHLLVEGMLISAFALKAYRGYIFLRGEYIEAAVNLRRAIAEATEAGLLGKNIMGTGFDFELFVHTGAGRYICGEETALINSLEGRRANPRSKPPFPATSGAWGKPTCVNNVETLCNVPAILANGVEWYQNISKTDVLGIPASDVEGVATFYSQIFRQPVGRHVIRYCDSVVCHINGYQGIQAALEKKLNIKPGQTTFDGRFTLLPTCCLGNCDKGPNMMIDEDTHAHLTPEAIPELLERYK